MSSAIPRQQMMQSLTLLRWEGASEAAVTAKAVHTCRKVNRKEGEMGRATNMVDTEAET